MLYQAHTFESGLRFVHRPLSSPVVYIGIAIGVGSRHEARRAYGLAHFMEHMLFKGTRLRNSKQIIQRLEEVGAELNAYTSKEETILYALCPRPYAQRAMQLMADIVQHSRFDAEELRKEQTVVIDEIQGYEDSPSELIWDEFEDIVFRGHSLGHCILGTEASVNRFTPKIMQSFYAQHYRPDNMVVFTQGDIDVEAMKAYISQYFASAPQCTPYKATYPSPKLRLEPQLIVRRRGTHQRHILMGATAYSMFDKRRLGLSLLVNILGGPGMSSRLNMRLREEAGYVYHIDCSYTAYSDTGLVAVAFGCASQHESDAIALVEEELRRIAHEPLTERELLAAKKQLKGQLTVSADGHEHYFLGLGKAFLHHGKAEHLELMMQRIDALGVAELYEIAREIFPPERMHQLIYR